jgi:hypothetical protein
MKITEKILLLHDLAMSSLLLIIYKFLFQPHKFQSPLANDNNHRRRPCKHPTFFTFLKKFELVKKIIVIVKAKNMVMKQPQ